LPTLASAVLTAAFMSTPLSAQAIDLTLGDSVRIRVLPGAAVAVPLGVDLSARGTLTVASLQGTLRWGAARLRFDSLRAVPGPGWAVTVQTAGADTGAVRFAAYSSTALAASGAVAVAYFTAAATPGGTRVDVALEAAGNEAGGSILASTRVRGQAVCAVPTGQWGDVNDDGTVNVQDAQQVARFSVGLSVGNASAVAARGDVTADAAVNVLDAQQIARFSVGLGAAARVNTALWAVPAVASVAIVPGGAATVPFGGRRALGLVARAADGLELSGCVAEQWTSSDTTVATVSASGLVTGRGPGTATITGRSGTASGTVTATVSPAPVASVTVSPATATVMLGATRALTATVRDSTGAVLTGRAVAWTSSDTTMATVSTTGIVTANAAGTVTVAATADGVTGSSVLVTLPDTPGLRMTLLGPAGTGFFVTEVAGANLSQPIWTLHSAEGDSSNALIDTPHGGPLTIRAYAIDQRTNPTQTVGGWARMLGARQANVALVPADRRVTVRLVTALVQVDSITAPDTVDAFTTVPVSWDVVDSSGLVSTFGNHHVNSYWETWPDGGIGPFRVNATSTLLSPSRRRYVATIAPQDSPGLRYWRVVHWQETPRGILALFAPSITAGEPLRKLQVRSTRQALRINVPRSEGIGTFFIRLTGGGLPAPVWRRVQAASSGTTWIVQDVPAGSGFDITVFAMDARMNPATTAGGWSIVRGVARRTGLAVVAYDTALVDVAPRTIQVVDVTAPDTVRVGTPISVSWTLSDTTGAVASFANHHIGFDTTPWPDGGIGPNPIVATRTLLSDGRYRYTAVISPRTTPGRITWKINHWQEVGPLEGGGILAVFAPSTVGEEAPRYIVIIP
jgi:hypothetical protein